MSPLSETGFGVEPAVTLAAAKPVESPHGLAAYLTSGFWAATAQPAYRFATGQITFDLSGFSPEQAAGAGLALAAWSDAAGLQFINVTGSGLPAMLTFTNNEAGATTRVFASEGIATAAVVNVWQGWDSAWNIGSYGLQTLIHEIGHALGLGHLGPYDITGNYASNALYANDTVQYSIMSYFWQNNFNNQSFNIVGTPMMADILALYTLYGPNYYANIGNTRYGYGASSPLYNAELGRAVNPSFTIVDRGGEDILSAELDTTPATIDLRPGGFSSMFGLAGNVAIFLDTIVEHGIGGQSDDVITGNDVGNALIGAGGNDVLRGGPGDDYLDGGPGADRLEGGPGNDRYILDQPGDLPIELPGEGFDTVVAAFSYTLPDHVDRLELVGQIGLSGIGNAGDNQITGTDANDTIQAGAGNDAMAGGAGDDFVDGGPGADWMWGGLGNDQFVVDNAADAVFESFGEGYDIVHAAFDYALPANVEALSLSAALPGAGLGAKPLTGWVGQGNELDNRIQGTLGSDRLFGHAGDDRLIGSAGDDVLDGGGGVDFMAGGGGHDIYYVDDPADIVREASAKGHDIVYATVPYLLPDNVEELIFLA